MIADGEQGSLALGDAGATAVTTAAPAPTAAPAVMIARVIVNEPLGLLDYSVPESFVASIGKGTPVKVPLGKRTTRGYVAEAGPLPPPTGVALREVAELDNERPCLPAAIIDLCLFAASYYGASPGDMLAVALPAAARVSAAKYRLTEAGATLLVPSPPTPTTGRGTAALADLDRALLTLAQAHAAGFTAVAVERHLGCSRAAALSRLSQHVRRGTLARVERSRKRRVAAFFQRTAAGQQLLATPDAAPVTAAGVKVGPKARALLASVPLDAAVAAATLAAADRGAHRRLKLLEASGLVERVLRPVDHAAAPGTGGVKSRGDDDAPAAATPVTPPVPTPAQEQAITALCQAIDAGRFSPFLLRGVTGSGKTEVYLRAIAHALAHGKSALVLVPEIALTPQLAERFRERFHGGVAIFHSGLTAADRFEEWQRVARGEARIGLGARSALFLPLRDLGVIVVDEEHETSFKQEEAPRYNARDLAVVRGRLERAVVCLGSATPALESQANADGGRYQLLSLPTRVMSRPLPEVECVSLASVERVDDGFLSVRLARALERTLSLGEQAILYLNRRGFSPYVYCRDCGHAYKCVDCDVSLTLHRRRDALVCHYCGFEEPAPDECPKCHGARLTASGLGVERLEAEITQLFGGVEIARLDRDSIRHRNDLVRALQRFRSGAAKVLVGTQMVAKGHDFPGVTLVGVVHADASLNFPDFRAAERTFQLLTQVAGRAGRGDREGHVIVQAYATEHYAVQAASRHDFAGFVAQELEVRREHQYPPFSHLVLLRLESRDQQKSERAGEDLAAVLRERAAKLEGGCGSRDGSAGDAPLAVLGPAAAPLSRLRGLWRTQILLKGSTRPLLRALLTPSLPRPPNGVRQILDVDPYSML